MSALLDTGFLLALLAKNDPLHEVCLLTLSEEATPLVPSPLLPELAYMVLRDIGYTPWLTFVRSVLQEQPPLV